MKEKKERKFHHLTPTDRAIIEKYLKRKIPSGRSLPIWAFLVLPYTVRSSGAYVCK